MHNLQRLATGKVADIADDRTGRLLLPLGMTKQVRIHLGKSPNRRHYIVEWAEHRHMTQADIVRSLGVDKGTVSRWFSGNVPRDDYLDRLAAMFALEDRFSLFRHPDDDWLSKFMQDRNEQERQRIMQMLELAFPRKQA